MASINETIFTKETEPASECLVSSTTIPNISIEFVHPKEDLSPKITLHGCDIEQVKACFISAILDKDEENALLWGYELYYSNLQFESFYILNELYQLFYVDKHHYYFNGYLQTLAKEWEASKRKNATILGSIIKNIVHLDISITDMVSNKNPNPNIEKSGGVAEGHDAGILLYSGERPKGARRNIIKVLKYDVGFPDIADFTELAGDPTLFKKMTIEDLGKLKKKLKKLETKSKTGYIIPKVVKIPFYLCELFEIGVTPESFVYTSFKDWCNIHANTSSVKTVVLRIKKKIRK